MRTPARLAGACSLALAAGVLLAGPASASAGDRDGGAVFVQNDSVSGNAIIAYSRAADGPLRQAGTYPTGGLGGALDGAVVDHLASQGSVALDRQHGLLYAVNAGSDTVTVFSVHGDSLARRQVVSSGGAFPASIAVHGNVVYVLNARNGGSVQGYLRVGDALIRIPAWRRSLGLDPTPTPEFTHTPGQVAFTPDGSKLIVTTKGASNAVDVFSVGLGGLSATPTVTELPDAVPFAVSFDNHQHLVLTEAGPNAVATFSVGRNGTLTPIGRMATGQAGSCWVAVAGARFYASNAGSGTLSGYTERRGGALVAIGNTATDPGTVDAAVTPDGRHLYVQTGANGTVDGYRIDADGSLTPVGSVTVPDAVGAEGIAAS